MRTPLFIIRYIKYEYWPWWLFYLPIVPYWLYFSVKNKSLTYLFAANPAIPTGGFVGESKSDILKLIDSKYLPNSMDVEACDLKSILDQMKARGIIFPVIAKPDVGERGFGVSKINNEIELEIYNSTATSKYIIQEFVDYEIELGILYSRLPNSLHGEISSVTRKVFLSVEGDGSSTINELMQRSTRARFQIKRIGAIIGEDMEIVLAKGQSRLLEPIGNHCRGTRFIDNNFLINKQLVDVFNEISLDIKGFYFGRFDLKVKSIEDLYQGKNIKIMELNGASSEPGHIYDSSNSVFKAYRDMYRHWRRLEEVSRINIQNGHRPESIGSVIKELFNQNKNHKRIKPEKESPTFIAG